MVQHWTGAQGLGWCTHWCHRLRKSGAERAASTGTAATLRELLATWRFSSFTRSGFEKVVRFSFIATGERRLCAVVRILLFALMTTSWHETGFHCMTKAAISTALASVSKNRG